MPKFKTMSIRVFMVTTLIIFIYLMLFYILFEYYVSGSESGAKKSFLPYVVVHLDLKGAPPKISYLMSLLPILRRHGANGLLIEYEDMFPYEGKLVNLSALNRYSKQELTNFLSHARDLGFEVMPLLQTFGHMEFALKLEEYTDLRERPDYPDSICPSKAKSKILISEMIEQVMDLHSAVSRVKFIHIGCDEVYGINRCARCQRRELSDAAIFTQHVLSVAGRIKSRYPNTTVLIWDDMLRSIKPFELTKLKLRGRVEPVYWNYEPVLRHTHINLFKYHINSDNIWVASAFKGADGRTAAVPNMTARYLNNYNWMKLINDYRKDGTTKSYNFKGIILTGWSRYAHTEPLCELLPVSVSCLFLCLQVIKTFKTEIHSSTNGDHREDFYDKYVLMNVQESLNCTAENFPSIKNITLKRCDYKEKIVYDIINNLDKINNEFLKALMNLYVNGIIQQLDTRYDRLNLSQLKFYEKEFSNMDINLKDIEERLKNELKNYFHRYVIEEYVNSKIQHQKMLIEQILRNIKNKYIVKNWQRKYNNV